MAKDTKKIIIETLLNIAVENGPITVEEIYRRSGITRNTIQRNFNNQGITGIVDYISSGIIAEINEQLSKYEPEELPIEIFADILLSVIWQYRREVHIISTSTIPYVFPKNGDDIAFIFLWGKKRFEYLVKEHKLAPVFSAQDLLKFWNSYIFAILSFWLASPIPIEPRIFKPYFLFLAKTSMYDLIYKDIGIH